MLDKCLSILLQESFTDDQISQNPRNDLQSYDIIKLTEASQEGVLSLPFTFPVFYFHQCYH